MFKHGNQACGGLLQFRTKWIKVSDRREPELIAYYCCSSAECDYREYPPLRKPLPQLAFEAVSSDAFKACMALHCADARIFPKDQIVSQQVFSSRQNMQKIHKLSALEPELHSPGYLQCWPHCTGLHDPGRLILPVFQALPDIRWKLGFQKRTKAWAVD